MTLKILTLLERIPNMTQQELAVLAEGEALAISDSSRLEGLALDQARIRTELLAGYLSIQAQKLAETT